MTNDLKFDIPNINTFGQIRDAALQKVASRKKPRTALVVPSDIEMLQAFAKASLDGIIDPYIIGDEKLLKKNISEKNINLGEAKIIDINEPDMAVITAARMIQNHELDILVKGRISTVSLLRILFENNNLYRINKNVVSHIAVMKPALYDKLLLLTDAAVNIEPDLSKKISIVNNAVEFSNKIGLTMPRVALLAAVEVIYPQMPVTMDAAVISKMAERKQIKNAYVDGPLSFDMAVDLAAAHGKGIFDSKVAGQADILVAPNIETANGVYKALTLYADIQIGGIIYGGRFPVVISSRADSLENKYNSILLGVMALN